MVRIDKETSLAIVELNYHQELIYSLCRLFKDSKYRITIFTLSKTYHEIAGLVRVAQFQWILKDEEESVEHFLRNHRQELNKHDFVLFNTIDREINYLTSLNLKSRIMLRVHNVNTFLGRSGHLIPVTGVRTLLKNITYGIWEPLRYQKLDSFLAQVDIILVPDETIAEYIRSQNLINNFLLEVLPLSFFTKKKSNLETHFKKINKRKIVIPGIIDVARKDYDTLAGALKMVEKELREPVEILFLGGLKNSNQTSIIENFQSISSDMLNISISEEWVPQTKFDKLVGEAAFMVAPTNIETKFDFFKEIYGQTKMSGAVSDVVRYGKPSIMPAEYQLNSTLKAHIEQYQTTKELKKIILKYLDCDYLHTKYTMLWASLEEYRIKYNLQKFDQIINNG